jgi:hypothetical protein
LDLQAMAKKSGRANDEYLHLYTLEGFLLRLAASASSQDFILKGGVLGIGTRKGWNRQMTNSKGRPGVFGRPT